MSLAVLRASQRSLRTRVKSFAACCLALLLLSAAPFASSQEKKQPTPPPKGVKPHSDISKDRGEQPVPETTAATESMLGSYNGQNVVSLQVAGQPDIDQSKFLADLPQKAGKPFSKDAVNQSAAALKQQGHYQAVRIEVDPDAQGVRVMLIAEPAFYFGVFQFPGATPFTYSRLIQVANYPIQTAYNPDEVTRDSKALLKFYRQEGYFHAEVNPVLKSDPAHKVVNVVFNSTMGKKAKFGEVIISGLPNDKDHHLENSLKTFLARLRQAAIRPGKAYHHSTLERATGYLQTELNKRGLLAAQVQLAGAQYHADTNRADIHFNVKPGRKINVQIDGAHVWSWDKKKLLPMYQGVGVDPETVQEGNRALASYFQGKGYFEVKVDSHFKKGPKGDTVVYTVAKDHKHKVESVKITGNKQVPSSKLAPQVAVQKEHLFSRGKFNQDLVHKSVANLKAVYQAEGFSSVQVVPTVNNRGGDVYVSFAVTEGPRDIVQSLKIEGANTFPASQYAPNGLKLAQGQPYSSAHIVADRTEIMANYLKAGYLTASFRETASAVSKNDPHHIDVVYHIVEGPRVITGDIITLGREHTRQRLIDGDIVDLKAEQPLTETSLLTAGTHLYDHTGVFDWAEIDPKRPITTQSNEDVLVKVHEAHRNTLTYGFGFEVINRGGSIPSGTVALPSLPPVGLPGNFRTSQTTFYGPRGTFQYTRNNIRGKAESFSFTAFAGRLDQRFAVYYIDPTFRWSPWKATSSVSYEKNEENPIFSSQQELGSVQLQRAIDHAQKNILFFRYAYSHTNITRVLIDALVPQRDRNIRLSTLATNFTRDTRDNPLDEHSGVLDSLEFDFNTSKLGSNVDFTKLTGQAAIYREKFHHIVWADSLRVGIANPFSGSFVPLSESFFTGGGNSLRGYPLDGAGPQNSVLICVNGQPNCPASLQQQITVPAGGNSELILNSEARIPLPIKQGLSIVPFYDGGNVFAGTFGSFGSTYSNNVGIGLRYATPVGPIRFDIGQNLNPVNGIKSTNYFISIGQAF